MCGNNEVLETSWLLRQRVDGCSDKWQSTNIGQTWFTREIRESRNENAVHGAEHDASSEDDYYYNDDGVNFEVNFEAFSGSHIHNRLI